MMISTTTAFVDVLSEAVSSTALTMTDLGFTAEELAQASRARITCETSAIRYLYTGTVPTTTGGHYLAVNTNVEILGVANISALQFIRNAAADGAVTITLER